MEKNEIFYLTTEKKFVYIETLRAIWYFTLAGWQNGYAEDCKSFDIGSIPVPASKVSFRLSSVVEQSAVNRSVVGSSPTVGAILKKRSFLSGKGLFFVFQNGTDVCINALSGCLSGFFYFKGEIK